MSQIPPPKRQARKVLTDLVVRQAKPRPKPHFISDGDPHYRGLYLLVLPNGLKQWRHRYTYRGKACMEGLGAYPHTSLSEARAKLLHSKAQLKKDENPTEIKRLLKQNQLIAASNTFERIASKWFEWRKKKKDLDERNALKIWASLEKHAFPLLGHKAIADIKPHHILELIERMQNKGIGDQTIRVFQRIRDVFNYAIATMLLEVNPTHSINTDIIIKTKTKHHPALPLDWIGRFLKDIDQSKASLNTKVAIRMQILTGVRTTELRGAMWDEIDLDKAIWTIPTERKAVNRTGGGMKMRQQHLIPLSRQLVHILKELKAKRKVTSEFLFHAPNDLNKCMSDVAISKLMKDLGYDGNHPDKPHAVPHGFRTTLKMTALLSKQFEPRAIEFQLAHINKNAVEAAYEDPSLFYEERTRICQWYSDTIEAAIKEQLFIA
ncbi:tyrosine-type recombinase/integrase [Hydromonas duriensis]|uniref:Site-specific recombinase XerC n=1 Tax=Hydromonas duriensis TaxID=1527608 RepID=A0A4R6Y6D4_9BURK|nr:tyrosine-type recombinase/integrase [Hydromonas duriensis]TDR31059.1 site-specific recombinase XerC [Hydromonas duriensis]